VRQITARDEHNPRFITLSPFPTLTMGTIISIQPQ
jgi:hypothetical protein